LEKDMSVVPFVIGGENPTIVTNGAEFTVEGQAILVRNLEEAQFDEGSRDSNTSYDLRVGDRYRDHRTNDTQMVSEQGIELLPRSAVIIQCEEWVHFPKRVFGHILPRVSLLNEGISNTPSKVDPGYNGPLLITTFNHGKKTVWLKRGQRFCSLYMMQVLSGVRPYDKDGKQLPATQRQKRLQRLRDYIEANVALFTAFSGIGTIVAVIVSLVAIFVPLWLAPTPR
jgi:dCTP deaminase